ncbi:MAG: beta-ketoacyl-[acyl-carrier-protein] synthase II, partial [Novibacillus thermophilus]
MNHRVVITGMGVVSPLGNDKETFWDALLSGKSGIGPITHFDASQYPSRIAGEVKHFDPLNYMEKKDARRMDRFVQFAVAAAKMALEDAAFDMQSIDPDRVGVYIGSGIGGLNTWEEQHRILLEKGPRRVSPFFIPMM